MIRSSVIFLLLMKLVAGAVVVGGSHVQIDELGGGDYNIRVAEFELDDRFGDYTCFLFSHVNGSNFQYGGSCLDDGVSAFFVESGDRFSEANILGGEFVELDFGIPESYPAHFYFGFRTPNLAWGEGFYPPAYGWAEFQHDGAGNLSLVDYAIAFGSQGIVVNTTIPIPEPKGVFCLLGLIIFLGRHRRYS